MMVQCSLIRANVCHERCYMTGRPEIRHEKALKLLSPQLSAKFMQQRSFREFNLVSTIFHLPTPKGAREIFFSRPLWGGEMKEPGNEVVENLNLKMSANEKKQTKNEQTDNVFNKQGLR